MQFNIPAEFKNASGVYIIRSTVNDKVYVGSTKRLRARFLAHRSLLEKGQHHSKKMQRHANKHGVDNLAFCLVELAQACNLIETEQKWIDFYNAYKRGFNALPIAGSRLGMVLSSEARMNISMGKLGRPVSDRARKRISEACKGRVLSEETRRKMFEARLPGIQERAQAREAKKVQPRAKRAQTVETKQKISSARMGQKPSEETKQKMSLSRAGVKRGPMSDAQKLALSSKAKGRKMAPFSAEHKQNLIKARRERSARERGMQSVLYF